MFKLIFKKLVKPYGAIRFLTFLLFARFAQPLNSFFFFINVSKIFLSVLEPWNTAHHLPVLLTVSTCYNSVNMEQTFNYITA